MTLARGTILFAATALALAFLPAAAQSQAYPQKAINFIIPFGAGGGTDIIARTLQEDIRRELGQPIVIENRPGANGAIGSAAAARAAPDGYTLLLTASSTFSLNPNLMNNIQYDQIRDFVPVGFFVRAPWMMVVHEKSQFKSVADLVKAARENPEKFTFGYWQSNVMITGEIFQKAAGIKLLKVPYKGVTEALSDLVGQRIDVLFIDIQAVRGYIDAGTVKYLAATTANRVSVAPNVPTLAELGYTSVVTDASVILFAPSKTPPAILTRLNEAMIKVVSGSQAARKQLMGMGHEPATMTLPELDNFVRVELSRWGEMISSIGLSKQ